MLTDYHVHLRPDAETATAAEHLTAANAERYRAAAEEHGIAELGVAEHVHRFTAALEVWRHPWYRRWARDDLEAYVEVVREETDLRLGLECDFLPGREDRLANLLEPYDWDYVVGSVHFLREESVDAEDFDVWDRAASADQVWKRYFETLGEAARSGLFDILAHPDLVKVWGPERPRPEGDLRRFYERAMDGIAESRIAVEVSTAGLRNPVSEIYPDPAFLSMCLEAGCPVALSSDAHVPAQIGFRYERALELLDGLWVTELAVFERRERRLEPIG